MGNLSKRYKEDYLYDQLQDPKEASAYINECLKDDDPNIFYAALKDVANANDIELKNK